jgi:hypothetical protein
MRISSLPTAERWQPNAAPAAGLHMSCSTTHANPNELYSRCEDWQCERPLLRGDESQWFDPHTALQTVRHLFYWQIFWAGTVETKPNQNVGSLVGDYLLRSGTQCESAFTPLYGPKGQMHMTVAAMLLLFQSESMWNPCAERVGVPLYTCLEDQRDRNRWQSGAAT